MSALEKLSAAGVSVWLDDLSRARLTSGSLAELVESSHVVGVTTNPTIFASALADSESYADALAAQAAKGASREEAVDALMAADVAEACDLLMPIYEATDGEDGRVSIEVSPALARDAEGTVEAAVRLHALVDRPNVMIKIPATIECLPAITQVIARGISVNVTLVFGLDRYRKVVEAYLSGLERAREAGIDLSTIRSVASIFVSRVDTAIDAKLDALGTDDALGLRGGAGLANCRLAHEICGQLFSSERFAVLEAAGARVQRPLWASTGTKDPSYPDTMYVTGLITAGTVNTMPEKTLLAFADHGEVPGDTVVDARAAADEHFDALARMGIDYAEVMDALEAEGLEKFDVSFAELLDAVGAGLERSAS